MTEVIWAEYVSKDRVDALTAIPGEAGILLSRGAAHHSYWKFFKNIYGCEKLNEFYKNSSIFSDVIQDYEATK